VTTASPLTDSPDTLSPLSQYNYNNVTISGLPGCGSTTLLNELRELLKFDGWSGFNGGEFMRAYAAEKGLFDPNTKTHHAATVYDDDFDRQVDMGIREKVEHHKHWIIESWLSGFMAQQVPGTLKVLMVCSEYSVRVDRIVNRDTITVDEAKHHLQDRYQANLKKWARMYANEWQEWVVKPGVAKASDPIDFWRPDLYDIVIDTYATNQQQALEIVMNAIKV
jgi:cytidylate kinase